MAYGDFKDLAKRTASDKVVRDKAFNIAKNVKYDGYKRGFVSMVYKFFDKKSAGNGVAMLQNQQLAEEFHKSIIKKLKKRRVYSSLKGNIQGADLADMQLISKFNKGFRFLLCTIDIFSKYAWAAPSKNKKRVFIVNAFQKILDDSKRRPNEVWVDQGSEFYNNYFKTQKKMIQKRIQHTTKENLLLPEDLLEL